MRLKAAVQSSDVFSGPFKAKWSELFTPPSFREPFPPRLGAMEPMGSTDYGDDSSALASEVSISYSNILIQVLMGVEYLITSFWCG